MSPRHGLALVAAVTTAFTVAGCRKGPSVVIPPPKIIERPLASASVSPRVNHATAELADGRVLVVGGWGLRQSGTGAAATRDELREAVAYEPQGDRWVPAGEMAVARLRHTATLLADGRVLVVGGLNRDKTAAMSAEFFDPTNTSWKDASGFINGRDGHQAVALEDGTVLVVGGITSYPGASERAETFDPRSGRWQPAGKLASPFYGLSLTVLADGQVLAAGGFSLLGGVSGDCFLFDPKKRNWARTGKLRTDRYGHTATRLQDGRVLVTGGWNQKSLDSVEMYDPASRSWAAAGKLVEPRHTHTATLVGGGNLLITGGQTGTQLQAQFYLAGTPVRSIEVYRPQASESQLVGRLSSPHFYHSATALKDGRVLVLGGLDDEQRVPTARASAQLGYALVQFPQ